MTVSQLCTITDAINMTPGINEDAHISSGYVCDMLSRVMANGKLGMAWVTVQTHLNVIAVAVLMEMTAIILPEGIEPEPASIEKAKAEGIAVLKSPLTAYAICSRMAASGIPA